MDGLEICGKALVDLKIKFKYQSGLNYFTDQQYHKIIKNILLRTVVQNNYSKVLILSAGVCLPLVLVLRQIYNCTIDIVTKHPGNFVIEHLYQHAGCRLIYNCPMFDDLSELFTQHDLVIISDNQYLVKPSMFHFKDTNTDILAITSATKDKLSKKYTLYQPRDLFEYQSDWSFENLIDSDQVYYENIPIMFVLGHNRKL